MNAYAGSAALLLLPCLLTLPAEGAVVYSNDFESGESSLDSFVVSQSGTAEIAVVDGQAVITNSPSTASTGVYASINTSPFPELYTSTLGDNPGIVTWSFNVANQDGQSNNTFGFALASSAANPRIFTSSSYVFQGGGFVGNRMGIWRQIGNSESGGPSFVPIIDIPNGLATLPEMGSIRITYDPASDQWSLYGVTGPNQTNPREVNTLLGSANDGTLTDLSLPWMGIYSRTTGQAFFDNITVTVDAVPEPTTVNLFLFGLSAWAARRSRCIA